MADCYFCGASIPADTKIYRTTLCRSCSNPLKICYNCRFYDPQAPYQCLEHILEPVEDKETANFCEYFTPALRSSSKSSNEEAHQKAVDAFNSLFSD